MRVKVCVLLAAVVVSTLMLPIATAGAATGTICKTDSGSETFSPTLPRPPASANTTLYSKGRFGGCNNGVTGGTWTAAAKWKNANCGTIPNTTTTFNETIHWSPASKGTSTLHLVTHFEGVNTSLYTGTVTAGRFEGTKVTINFALLSNNRGACLTTGLKTVTFKQGTTPDHI